MEARRAAGFVFALSLIFCLRRTLAAYQDFQDDGDGAALSERFFNDIETLIKRRVEENPSRNGLLDDNVGVLPGVSGHNSRATPLDPGRLFYAPQDAETPPDAPLNAPTPVLVDDWPKEAHFFGQVTAVAIDPHSNPVILHRGERYWNPNTFNDSDIYFPTEAGPITEKTIYVLDAKTGAIKFGWAERMFYMPHGMSIDVHGNYWVTDVAMHQVFKFKPYARRPLLTIGRPFNPGPSTRQLCKPTAVAVATTGEFFIADGYCNQRILEFNAAGRLLRVIPQPPEFLYLQVPHGVTLLEHLDLLCIADRENKRVVCPKAGLRASRSEGLGLPAATVQEPDLGRVFDVAAYGDIVYAVNGQTSMLPVRGFTIDPRSEGIIGHWGDFKNPHSIAVDVNGSSLYVTEAGANAQENRVWKYVLV